MKITNQNFIDVIKEQAQILGIELPDNYGNRSKETKEETERLKDAVNEAVIFTTTIY